MTMKQLEVQIMGQSYLLGCPDGGDASLLDVVNRVDLAMCKIRDSGKIKARDRIAVLAALNLTFEAKSQLQDQLQIQAQAHNEAMAQLRAQFHSQMQATAASVSAFPEQPAKHLSEDALALAHDASTAISDSESAQLFTLIERIDVVLNDNPQLF